MASVYPTRAGAASKAVTALHQWLMRWRPVRRPDFMIVGLGNPGERYRRTRHNIGFLVLDYLSGICGVPLGRRRFDCHFGVGSIGDRGVVLVAPQAFMNRSGPPVLRLLSYYGISSEAVLIIHDDIDLAFGRLKIKEKGGHGGHNGLKSVMDALGSGAFARLRIGIGRPARGGDVVEHVLGTFSAEEERRLDAVLSRASDAAVTVLRHGAKAGMNRFHPRTKNSPETSDGGKNGRCI